MIVQDQLKLDALERELVALKERHFALQERYEKVITERDAFVRLLDADSNVVSAMVKLQAMIAEKSTPSKGKP